MFRYKKFSNDSEKRVKEATEEATEFYQRREKIERVLIAVFTVIITAIIMGFVFGIR